MNFKQSFKLAIKSLSASKMRSFLTMLGIIIGVASVIVLVSMVEGMRNTMIDQFESMGTNLISVTVKNREGGRKVTPEDMINLTTDKNTVLAGCSPNIQTSGTAKVGNKNIDTTILGVSEEYSDIRKVKLQEGRFIEFIDVDRRLNSCVVGSYIVKELFDNKSPLGANIKINNDVYKIVGVLEETARSNKESNDDKIIIPYTNGEKFSPVFAYVMSAKDEDKIDLAIREIKKYLFKVFNDEDSYNIFSQDEMLDAFNDLTSQMTMILVGIAGISLLVGGIGIMNIMLVSVTERTKEIGIRKSLGAKHKDIMSQFVIEAATSGVIGGIAGIVLGGIASFLAGKLIGITIYPSPNAVFLAFFVSALIGMVFGYFPAKKAAKLNPIDALRYE